MVQKILSTAIAMAVLFNAAAQGTAVQSVPQTTTSTAEETPESQQEESPFRLTGFADVYYKYDFNRQAGNNRTSFTNSHNSFELGMISLKAEHAIGKIGMVADLGFGQRADDFSYNDNNSRVALKQLYLSYAPVENFKISAGSWATHIGYELVDAPANRNYSMSYMFSYGPFFHTGVKGELTLGKNTFMLGVANPSDLKSTSLEHKYLIGQYATRMAEDKLSLYISFLSGKPNDSTRSGQLDAVLSGSFSDQFSMGFNGTIASGRNRIDGKYGNASNWWGSAVYINVDPNPWLGMTLRTEYFDDNKQMNVFGVAPKGGAVFSNTFSLNFTIDKLRLIPEFRVDNASEAIYMTSSGTMTKTSSYALLAAVYSF